MKIKQQPTFVIHIYIYYLGKASKKNLKKFTLSFSLQYIHTIQCHICYIFLSLPYFNFISFIIFMPN